MPMKLFLRDCIVKNVLLSKEEPHEINQGVQMGLQAGIGKTARRANKCFQFRSGHLVANLYGNLLKIAGPIETAISKLSDTLIDLWQGRIRKVLRPHDI